MTASELLDMLDHEVANLNNEIVEIRNNYHIQKARADRLHVELDDCKGCKARLRAELDELEVKLSIATSQLSIEQSFRRDAEAKLHCDVVPAPAPAPPAVTVFMAMPPLTNPDTLSGKSDAALRECCKRLRGEQE